MFQFSRERLHVQVLLFTSCFPESISGATPKHRLSPGRKYLDAECSKYEIGIAEKVCHN